MNASIASQNKRREENCTGRCSRRLRNQNGGHLASLCKSNILETQVIFPIASELARTLFPVKSTNDIKIKITHHKVIGDECIWEEMPLMNAC